MAFEKHGSDDDGAVGERGGDFRAESTGDRGFNGKHASSPPPAARTTNLKPQPEPARDRIDPPAPSPTAEQSSSPPGKTEPAAPAAPPAKPRRPLKAIILPAVGIVLLLAIAIYGFYWLTYSRYIIVTDDAYVRAEISIVAPKVSGYVAKVAVRDNARVKAGQLLVRIDPGDFRIALDAAMARQATQDAAIERIGRQIIAQDASIAQAEAQLRAARADLTRTIADLDRTRRLAAKDFSSRKTLDTARSDHARAVAQVQSAEALVLAAKNQKGVLAAQRIEAERLKAELATQIAKAQRDLDATEITAPFDGVVGNRAIAEGQYVQPGTRLMALVPLSQVFIVANFKETQLERLKVGQPVRIAVDAFSRLGVTGTIESFSPASGSQFSLLPPDNATGNFTKIVQRLPVRISVPADVAAKLMLRPGLSVIVRVDTREPKPAAPAGTK
ncbi:MAG: HlyD family secretion protein [Hyphomicrobiaceae bacterium]